MSRWSPDAWAGASAGRADVARGGRCPRAYALAVGVLGLALAVTACATSRFDALYSAGRYEEAVREYRSDTTLHHQERALFRTGLMHALPGSPVYDPDLARTELERLLTLFPKTGYRTEASRLIGLLGEVEKQQQAAADARDRATRLSARVDTLYRRMASLEDDLGQERAHLRTLEELSARLQADLKARQDSLARLRTELRKLKAIDLRSAHDSTSSDPHRPR